MNARQYTVEIEVDPVVNGEVYEVLLHLNGKRHAFMGTMVRMRQGRWYAVPQGRRIKGPFTQRQQAIDFLQTQLPQNLRGIMREAAA